jgi:rod shape determining protein RodA
MNSNNYNFLRESYSSRLSGRLNRPIWERMHLDLPLLLGLAALIIAGLFILYSASNKSLVIVFQQLLRFGLGIFIMAVLAQVPPRYYSLLAPWLFGFGLLLLLAVLAIGHSGRGAQRWLPIGPIRFQPSEIMKLATPMMLAWILSKKSLPPKLWQLLICLVLIIIPAALVLKQPDLGTTIIIMTAGVSVLLLAGIRWRYTIGALILAAVSTPVIWKFMHGYQRQRILTLFNPENDPLGTGYHIIQSKIAIGSGGLFGKGWLHGTQSHLQFLPEHATDFIFSVAGEELGFIGAIVLLTLFISIVLRCLFISSQAQDTFTRLLAGSLTLTFFVSFFVNISMVSGILPVVGVPLPLISYGGTSMVTMLAGFGMIMSIHTHRKLLGS